MYLQINLNYSSSIAFTYRHSQQINTLTVLINYNPHQNVIIQTEFIIDNYSCNAISHLFVSTKCDKPRHGYW